MKNVHENPILKMKRKNNYFKKELFVMFSNEIILIIIINLDLKSLIILSLTCKKYYNLCNWYIYNLNIKKHKDIIFNSKNKTCCRFFENLYKRTLLMFYFLY